ncbi:MAG: ABC transporter permease [Calditrichaceae bacterium]
MFKNYLKIAFRNLIKHKKFTFINLFGLAIGLACFILIMLWVQDELSYDRFHKNADNIYLALRNENGQLSGVSSELLAPAVKKDIPEVLDATSYFSFPSTIKSLLKNGDHAFEEEIALTDDRFFEIFSFTFKNGDYKKALDKPNSIVLTESMKQKYFGDEEALGKSLEFSILGQKRSMEVTGIIEDIPCNSFFSREIFISISFFEQFGISWKDWNSNAPHTFVLTHGEINSKILANKITQCEKTNSGNNNLENLNYSLLPLKKIHLHATDIEFISTTGDIKTVYIFSVIAAIILLIACMNYMNLANALSLKRTKEIGIQKVIGAHRFHMIRQYMGETVILTVLALGFALVLVELFLPSVNQLTGKALSTSYFNIEFLIMILAIMVVTSVVSGLYPSIFISGFQPIQILKGRFNVGKGNINIRKGLVIFQFTLSIIMMVSTIIVFSQLDFIRNSKLGYDKENVVCISLNGDISAKYESFKNELLTSGDIINISRSEPVDINGLSQTGDFKYTTNAGEKYLTVWVIHCDHALASTYNMELQEGRFYSDKFPTDKTDAFVINEAAFKSMGKEASLGQEIVLWGRKGRLIGVVKDFHFGSFHKKIEPLVFMIPEPHQASQRLRGLSIRIRPHSIHQSLSLIENKWKTFYPDQEFNYTFLDDKLNASYHAEKRMGTLFKYFSFLAIFIACLGLYGLTAFTIEQKTKHIGVYKVLGADITNIVYRLSKNYILWILSANLVAWPIAWYAMNKWLQNFAYHVDMSWWMFSLAGGIALTVALIAISWQAIHAAMGNPVESLRYE